MTAVPHSQTQTSAGPLTLLAGTILFLSIFWLASFQIITEDLGWQVATGRRVLQEGRLRFTDVFTWSANELEYLPVHALYYPSVAILYDTLGPACLTILKALATALTALAIFAALRHILDQRAEPKVAISLALAWTLLIFFLARDRWLLRPQVVSYLLFAALLWRLTVRPVTKALILGLGPTFAVAVNIHPGAAFAYGLVGAWALGASLETLRRAPRHSAVFAWILLASATSGFMAHIITPDHIRYLILHTDINARQGLPETAPAWPIEQWPGFWAAITVWATALLMGRGRVKPAWWIASLVLIAAAIKANRIIPYAMMLMVIMVAEAIAQTKILRHKNAWKFSFAQASLATIMVLSWPLHSQSGGNYRPGWNWNHRSQPVRATQFLKKIGFKGRLYNANPLGGYLLLHGYPDWLVYWDGRLQIHEENQRRPIADRLQGIEALVLTAVPDPGEHELLERAGVRQRFEIVFRDEGALVLLRKDGPWSELVKSRGAPHLSLPHRIGPQTAMEPIVLPGESEDQAWQAAAREFEALTKD